MGMAIVMRWHLRRIRHVSIVLWPSEWIARNWPWRMAAACFAVPLLALIAASRQSPVVSSLTLHYVLLILAVPALDSAKRVSIACLLHTLGTAVLLTRGDMVSSAERITQYPGLVVLWVGFLLAVTGANVLLCSVARSILWCRCGKTAAAVGIPCSRCGYRIDNLPSGLCPECGTPVSDEAGPFRSAHIVKAMVLRRLVAGGLAAAVLGGVLIWLSPLYRTLGPSLVLLRDGQWSLLHEKDAAGLLAMWNQSIRRGHNIKQEDVIGVLGRPDFEHEALGGRLAFYLFGQSPSDNAFVRVFFFYQGNLAEMNGGIMRRLPNGLYECCDGLIFGTGVPNGGVPNGDATILPSPGCRRGCRGRQEECLTERNGDNGEALAPLDSPGAQSHAAKSRDD